MYFEESNKIEKLGEKLGFVFSYFIFTTILYLILSFLNKIPESWNVLHLAPITLIIILAGLLIQKLLK